MGPSYADINAPAEELVAAVRARSSTADSGGITAADRVDDMQA